MTSNAPAPQPDADVRARRDVREATGETLFVEAGAGSGKTTALVGRVVSLIAGGTPLSAIAAITFTEKAAAELKDSLREALERAAADRKTPVATRDLCTTALEHIDSAAVQTLHGFAQRVLSQSPVEAGLPPAFEVCDDIEAFLNFDARWAAFLDQLLGEETSPLPLERALLLGFDIRKLKDVAQALHGRWDRLRGDTPVFEAGHVRRVDVSDLLDLLNDVEGALRNCPGCGDKLEEHIRERIVPYARRLRAETTEEGVIAVLTDSGTMKISGHRNNSLGIGKHWRSPSKDDVHALIRDSEEERTRIVAEARMAALAPILEAVRAEVLAYAEQRRIDGRLEFHDLLIRARDLLAADQDVRVRLGRQFERILIDEFQDTDPIQIEIASLIASASPAGPWDTLDIAPGRVFFVGDPKQSIYRFRNADIALYAKAAERFGAGVRRLTRNYRSVPGIVEWVNDVVGTLFAAGGDEQAPYTPLSAEREPLPGAGASVRFIGGPHQDRTTRDMRGAEAREIAVAIQATRTERWQVADATARRGLRNARLSDITILLPARTTLSGIERALEDAAIPFRVESQSLLYATQEVRDLINVLGAIDDPTDEVAVVAALRSPAFGCSDRALEAFAKAGGRWGYTRTGPAAAAGGEAVIESMEVLRRLHDERWHRRVNEFVELVTRERRLFEAGYAHRNPRQTWQRLRFVQERSRAYVDGGGTTLRGFVHWLRQQAETDARVTESVVPETDDDAVRILTVHAAKGLEFPIVLLAGLNTAPIQRWDTLVWDGAGRPHVRVARAAEGWDSPGYMAAALRDQQLDKLEKDRLLYVAATRARDYLVLSLHHTVAKGEPSFAQRLYPVCIASGVEAWRPVLALQQGFPEPVEARAVATPQQREAWIEERRRSLAAARRAPVFAATALKPGSDDKPEPDRDDDAPWRRGRAGTSIGRAVHAVLQTVGLDDAARIEDTVRAQAVAEGVAGREAEVRALVRSALAAPVVREAVASRFWREVYVGAPVADAAPGVRIEGFIDLLFETPEGLVIVDYKTDRVMTDAEIDAAVTSYRPQMGAYALALKELGLPRVVRCVFVFLRAGGAVERELTDIAELIATATSRLAEMASALAQP